MKREPKSKQVEIPWYYKGYLMTSEAIPEGSVGYCYYIVHLPTKKGYIGRKLLTSTTRKRIGVREKAATRTRKTFKVTVKESNWLQYNSSCKPLQLAMKENPDEFRKNILEFAHSKKHLHYLELKYMFHFNILEIDSWNDNIGGTIYRRDLIKPEPKTKENGDNN